MKKSIGIDLGTTNSVVSFKDTSVKIIRNIEGEEMTRSCVGFSNNEFIVGRLPYQLLKKNLENTILSVKRLMGGAIKDEMVQDMISNPYYKFVITSLKGGTEDAVATVLEGKQFTPEQISAEILKKLKADTEVRLGDEVTHAVITVPAYFTEKQKNATRIAAHLAGLKVKQLLAEPTAAAIAYGVENLKPGEAITVLIYDFGGGTFDLSILNIVDGQYMEAGTGGDRWMGGDDLDRKLQELVLKKASDQYKIDDIQALIDNLPKTKKDAFEVELRYQTEGAKIQLSSAQSAPVIIDNILEDQNGDEIDIVVTITRKEYENLISPFIEKSVELIEKLFKKVGYDISMIDKILLVGGTSNIPLVKQMLSDKFGSDKVKVTEKPMLAIAEGAGILAHRLGDDYEAVEDIEQVVAEISYSTNHNYFIELEGGEMYPLIEEQMPKPVNVIKTFKTTTNNQKIVAINIFSDVEEGLTERQTMGFYSIEDDLPVESELVFDITLGIDEIFEITVYPKNNKSKRREILLGRGNKDSRAMEFLSNSLVKMLGSEYTENQRDYFFKAVQKEIKEINRIGIDSHDSEKWEQIGTNTFSALEQAERITDEVDEDSLAILFAQILINEYPDIIDSTDLNSMKVLLSEIRTSDDTLSNIKSVEKLKKITDVYPLLITLFTVKMSSDKAAKINPSDAQKLLHMHDQIVRLFKQRQKDAAFEILHEALSLRDKYGLDEFSPGSIHVKK